MSIDNVDILGTSYEWREEFVDYGYVENWDLVDVCGLDVRIVAWI